MADLADKSGEATSSHDDWKSFDELRELNAQGGRLAAAVGLTVAVLGVIGYPSRISQVIERSRANTPDGVIALLAAICATVGVTLFVMATMFALLVLREPVPEREQLAVAVTAKKGWCRDSVSFLLGAMALFAVSYFGAAADREDAFKSMLLIVVAVLLFWNRTIAIANGKELIPGQGRALHTLSRISAGKRTPRPPHSGADEVAGSE